MSFFDILKEQVPNIVQDPKRPCYHEYLQKKDNLLVTVGDSWTWGDSLCGIDNTQEIWDHPDRVKKIYGALLASKLDADFINLAKCGGSNIEIYDWLKVLIEIIKPSYQNITIIITLTENYRESSWDQIWVPEETSTLEDYLCNYEKNMFESFAQLISNHRSIKFLIARNFTYSFECNKKILKGNLLDKIWVDCLAEYQQYPGYPEDVRFASGIALVPLHKLLKSNGLYKKYKFEFMSFYASSELAISWLEKSNLNYQKSTKHPTELGHEIWANYLYEKINSGV